MPLLASQPQRSCDYCGESIKGRADKRFCSQECRNGYHNHVASLNDAFMRKVNKILRQNRRILAALAPEDKNYVSRERLDDRGFNFGYYTHTRPARAGGAYTFCYEYGYIEIRPDFFLLFQRSEERRKDAASSAADAD